VRPDEILKSVIYNIHSGRGEKSGDYIIVFVRGDHDVSDFKIKEICPDAVQATVDQIDAVLPGSFGYTGPLDMPLAKYIDEDVLEMKAFVAGANEKDYHLTGVEPGDLVGGDAAVVVGDFRNALDGDRDQETGDALVFQSAIELGHIFKLNTRYSGAMGAKVLNAQGRETTLVMGCYGIGVSRLIAAVIEEHHDEKGIVWPVSLCPFPVVVTSVNIKDSETMRVSEEIYRELISSGIDVLWDDRDQSAGFKFKDADLVGFPVRIVVSPKNLSDGKIEIFFRKEKKQNFLTKKEAISSIKEYLAEA